MKKQFNRNLRVDHDQKDAADDIRAAYIVERVLYDARYAIRVAAYRPSPKADGGRSRSGRRYGPSWPKIAETLSSHGISWRQYLAFVFQRTSRSQMPVPPDRLAGPSMLSDYKKYRNDWLAERSRLAAIQLAAQARRLTEAEAFSYALIVPHKGGSLDSFRRHVLADVTLPLTPLFRYCAAANFDLQDVCEVFLDQAAWQFHREPWIYTNVWGEFIPEQFQRNSIDRYLDQQERIVNHGIQ